MAPTPWSGGLLKVGEATAAKRRPDLEQAEHHGTITMRASVTPNDVIELLTKNPFRHVELT